MEWNLDSSSGRFDKVENRYKVLLQKDILSKKRFLRCFLILDNFTVWAWFGLFLSVWRTEYEIGSIRI